MFALSPAVVLCVCVLCGQSLEGDKVFEVPSTLPFEGGEGEEAK